MLQVFLADIFFFFAFLYFGFVLYKISYPAAFFTAFQLSFTPFGCLATDRKAGVESFFLFGFLLSADDEMYWFFVFSVHMV